ncbi:hypothetical protein BVRB_4g092060 [Beta vulgaris subsp. vulgaris]|nr:hypothetical protein BVRB_4g092060 [Beta vulgaris subsp. vulgaris]
MPLITIGVLLWLLIKPSIPKCYIEEFDVFALRENTNSTHLNNTIYYNLKLKNRNTDKGVYYDTINLNFYYKPNEYTSLAIGNSTFTPFYQGKYKSTHRVGNIEPRGVRWGNATASTVMFRVELVTAVRSKIFFNMWFYFGIVVHDCIVATNSSSSNQNLHGSIAISDYALLIIKNYILQRGEMAEWTKASDC